jgi:hypothetical protein
MDVAAQVEGIMPAESDDHHFHRTDRELLLIVRNDMKHIREDIEEMTKKLDQAAPIRMFEDHERRLRVLEGFRWWILGGAAAAAFGGGMIARLLWH